MASTNKTENLGLNQWAASDAVEMEDFNADNSRLDAALGSWPGLVLLRDIQPQSADTRMITVDVSDINFGDYAMIILSFPVLVESGSFINSATTNIGATASGGTLLAFPMRQANKKVCFFGFSGITSTVFSPNYSFAEIYSFLFYAKSNATFGTDNRIQIWGVK